MYDVQLCRTLHASCLAVVTAVLYRRIAAVGVLTVPRGTRGMGAENNWGVLAGKYDLRVQSR